MDLKIMTPPNELKIWCAVRTDIEISKGKLATQAGHGYGTVIFQSAFKDKNRTYDYMANAQPKITVGVANLAELEKVRKLCVEHGLNHAFITDAGRTEFEGPTPTVCAFGPYYRDELPSALKRLRLL